MSETYVVFKEKYMPLQLELPQQKETQKKIRQHGRHLQALKFKK